MKKTYFAPETVISICEAIQVLAGTMIINPSVGPQITDGGEADEEDYDFSNHSLWDDDEE